MRDEVLAITADYAEIERRFAAEYASLVGDKLVFSGVMVRDESHHIESMAIECRDYDPPSDKSILEFLESTSRIAEMPRNSARVWKEQQARAPKPRDLYRSRGAR